jgi:lipopolysaccharide/colanic/teichoic acid biosynthesis glycosyltransferase
MGSFYRRRGKRIVDVVGAAGALVLTAPVQLVAAVVVRRSMGSPVLFRQERPGIAGKPFTLLKFRTMVEVRGVSGVPQSDAERLTPLGLRLRASSVDELPELWNVLRGDMSLVGPRPLLMEYLPRYSPEQSRRHDVRPGITGWAQVNGRNALSWDEKFEMDVWYVDNLSARLDARILWRTLATVLGRRGVSAEGHATTAEFNPTA